MARLKYNAQLEQALQDQEDDYTGERTSSLCLLSCMAGSDEAGS